MALAVIRAQTRRVGAWVIALPLLVGVLLALAGWATSLAWPVAQAMTLTTWLVQIQAIVAGVCVGVAVTGDPLIELQESTPTGFRLVQAIRAGLVALSGLAGAVVLYAGLHHAGVWPRDTGWTTVLFPAGSVVILAAVALGVAAFAGTMSATTIAVVAAWMFLAMLWDPYVSTLLRGRGIPLLAALLVLIAAWWQLGDAEHNIKKVAQL